LCPLYVVDVNKNIRIYGLAKKPARARRAASQGEPGLERLSSQWLRAIKVTECDLDPEPAGRDKQAASSQVSWNMKSSGKRSRLRLTA
jgi:hypothetical protein